MFIEHYLIYQMKWITFKKNYLIIVIKLLIEIIKSYIMTAQTISFIQKKMTFKNMA